MESEMLLLEHREVLRPEALETAPDLIGREPRLGHHLLFIEELPGRGTERNEDRSLGAREGDRSSPPHSGIGRAGHGSRRGNTG